MTVNPKLPFHLGGNCCAHVHALLVQNITSMRVYYTRYAFQFEPLTFNIWTPYISPTIEILHETPINSCSCLSDSSGTEEWETRFGSSKVHALVIINYLNWLWWFYLVCTIFFISLINYRAAFDWHHSISCHGICFMLLLLQFRFTFSAMCRCWRWQELKLKFSNRRQIRYILNK